MGKISHDTASCPASINASRTLPEYSHATRIFMSHPFLGLDGPSVKLDGFNNHFGRVVLIAQEALFTLLAGAILLLGFVLIGHVAEHSVKVFRRGIHDLVDLRIGPDQDQVARLFPLGKHTRYNVLSLSPEGHVAMRIIFRDFTDIF